jgi:Flp pilus assembly secretin CpaC
LAQQRDVGMVGRQSKAPGALPQAIFDLAQKKGSADAPEAAVAADTAEVELALADLVSDANGEVVIFNDSGFRTLALHTDSAVAAEGRVGAHITASGEDVTGFNYVTFENGVTVYFQEGLDLIVVK